ncbi:MAG: hypothetical protein U9M95_06475 [Candidatus Altiarchaeota archaeon]|nr:hypothetical protein [Candidatus Altiarchaeota archaeon]
MLKIYKDFIAIASTKEVTDEDKSRDIMLFPRCVIDAIEILQTKKQNHLGGD